MKTGKHKFLIQGEINGDQLSAFIACDLEAGPGELLINSTGGDITAGFALYDYIRCFSPHWRSTVIGNCLSAAMLPFLACKSRAITPNGSLMMHHGHVNANGIPTTEFAAFSRDAASLNDRYVGIMTGRSKAGKSLVEQLSTKGVYIYADKAIEHGFAHSLREFKK